MEKEKTIKNLSIGWVVEAQVVSSCITPGYVPKRKIVYRDYGEYGTDILYKNNKFPIIYPVVDFEKRSLSLENGEYVIVPFGIITTYLSGFGITLDRKINFVDKHKIKKIIFDTKNVLPVKKDCVFEQLEEEIANLEEFKLYSNPVVPSSSEYDYLNDLVSAKIYRK